MAKAKGEMFEFLSTNNGKTFVNTDIDIILQLAKKHIKPENIIQYNQQKYGMKILPNSVYNPFLRFVFDNIQVNTKLVGKYNIENILAAIAIGKYFSIANSDIANAIESYIPENNRSQQIKTARNTLYMDAYNANPTSMQVSLKNFIDSKTKNKMLIIGDMRELGKSSESEHAIIVKIIMKSGIKNVLLVGEYFTNAAKETSFVCFKNVDECIEYINSKTIENQTILIKGSHGIHLEKTEKYL